MITSQQRKLLLIIENYLAIYGFSPSYDEMRIHMGLRSKYGIFRIVNALEERSYIRRIKNKARSIEVIRPSESAGLKVIISPDVPRGEVWVAA